MTRWLSALLLAILALAPMVGQGKLTPPTTSLVFIGTQGNAILAARFDATSGTLTPLGPVARIARPTWIVTDPSRPLLYSVSEIGNYDGQHGRAASFAIDARAGTLSALGDVESGGGGPTHLGVDPRTSTLFVANFGDGAVSAIPVGADGRLASAISVRRNTGRGPTTKQLGPHAHQAVLDPSGKHLLVPDMGADRIFIYRFDARRRTLAPASPSAEATPPGSGPRHLSFSRDGRFVYLVTELSAEVRVFRWSAATGGLSPVQALAMDPPDLAATRSAAEISVGRDGRFVYASNRARSTIQVYAVDRASGRLTPVQDIATGGKRPRSFAIHPSGAWMLVGNQDSLTVSVFAIDRRTGRITQHGQPIAMPEKPVSFAFYPS